MHLLRPACAIAVCPAGKGSPRSGIFSDGQDSDPVVEMIIDETIAQKRIAFIEGERHRSVLQRLPCREVMKI